ncbi:MAG: LolA family protein [Mycobacteriales bacterium]
MSTAPTRARLLRWAVPVAVAAAVGVAATGVLTAEADPPLPAKTAAQLLVDLQGAKVDGLSGTVVQDSDLGLPALPSTGPGADSSSPLALLTGSHTLRVWYAGEDRQRLALLGRLGETDVIHNGRDAWLWSSGSNSATHYPLPAGTKPDRPAVPSPLTPQQAAEQALAAIDPTTSVSTDGTRTVAGRAAYELVLAPKDTRSLVGQVRLAIDAETSVPLRVQLFGRASSAGPAFSVGFTKVSFAVPADEQFRFAPPPGAKVTESTVPAGHTAADHPSKADLERAGSAVRTVGKGWTTVVVANGMAPSAADGRGPGGAILGQLQRVSGSWGTGRLLTSRLVSVLLTDDGRVVAGAVPPELLYTAAAR